jgi:hypothetical protein
MMPLRYLRSFSLCLFLIGYLIVNTIAQIPSSINSQTPSTQVTFSNTEEKGDYWAGRFYLKIKPSAHSTPLSIEGIKTGKMYPELTQLLQKYGIVSIERPFLPLKSADWAAVYDLQLDKKTTDAAFQKAISALSYIEYIEPVPIMRQSFTPNDPQVGNQYNLSKIKAFAAWDTHKGGNCVVAIVDDAVHFQQRVKLFLIQPIPMALCASRRQAIQIAAILRIW